MRRNRSRVERVGTVVVVSLGALFDEEVDDQSETDDGNEAEEDEES